MLQIVRSNKQYFAPVLVIIQVYKDVKSLVKYDHVPANKM